MATQASLAVQAAKAQQEALRVVAEHAGAERLASIELIAPERAHTGFPAHLAAFQAELMAALAEVLEGQERRIADQERRISELESAASASAKAPKKK